MPEFDGSDEVLPPLPRMRRRWITVACAGGAIALIGGGAVAVAESSASASPVSQLAAAASSSAAPHPSGTDAHRGKPGARPTGPIPPALFGSVKSVSGTKIVITDPQGFSRTIITSSKTTYKDGATASPATGTKILASGSVDADGTSLDATTIAEPKVPTGGAGSGGFGPGGQGGHGGPGDGSGGPGGFGPGGPGGPGGHGGPGGGAGRPTGTESPRPHPTGTPTGKPTGTPAAKPTG